MRCINRAGAKGKNKIQSCQRKFILGPTGIFDVSSKSNPHYPRADKQLGSSQSSMERSHRRPVEAGLDAGCGVCRPVLHFPTMSTNENIKYSKHKFNKAHAYDAYVYNIIYSLFVQLLIASSQLLIVQVRFPRAPSPSPESESSLKLSGAEPTA